MDSFWFAAYLVLAGLAIVQSLLLVLQTWEHRRYVRSCMHNLARHQPTGRAAVFAPCKGLDIDLEGNLRALLRQDYDDYEVTFVVEGAGDPAVAVIRRVMAEHPRVATRLVVAGRATHSGQKVHNLRAATKQLSPQVKYLAFVDSDARPRPEWLRALVARLCQHDYLDVAGYRFYPVVTGYRWFVPARSSIANHLLYSINCGVMSLLGRESHYLVWGGSWGIRREVFESAGLREVWEGTLSDDLMATRVLRRNGMPVRFEPACVVVSPLNQTPRQVISFLRRQYVMGRFYIRRWWVFALLAATLTNLMWLGNLAALITGLALGTPPAWMPACVCSVLYLLSVCRGFVRQDLVRIYFPDRRQALRKAGRFDIWASPVVGLVNWLGALASLFGRHVTWRGISYRIFAGGKIRVARREDQPAQPVAPESPGEEFPSYRKAA